MGKMSQFENNLREGKEVPSPVAGLRGLAKSYASKYLETAEKSVIRLMQEGWTVQVHPGPRGGIWHSLYATFRAIPPGAASPPSSEWKNLIVN